MDPSSEAVAEFCNVTSGTPEQARFYLEASNGHFERAVSMFYEQEAPRGTGLDAFPAAVSPYRPTTAAQQSRQGSAGRGWRQHGNLLGLLFRIPQAILQSGLGLVFTTFRFSTAVLGLLVSRAVPAPLLRSVQGRMRSLTHDRAADPQTAAANLGNRLSRQYGSAAPNWLETSWEEAAKRAHRRFKFLFVYLHSPGHQDTDDFYSQTICDSVVVDYVNTHFLSWAGDITHADAFQLAQGLRVAVFPCVALLAFSGPRMRLITAAEGSFPPEQLLPLLQEAQEQHSIHLLEEQVEQNERDVNRRLREEQDAEYQRSLEADRERERQRLAASRAQADAQRQAEEAAAKERAAKEAEIQRAADRQASITARKLRSREALGPEVAAGTSGCVQVRIRLPDGSNHQRRFLADEPLQRAYDFVDSLDNLATYKYSLASSYPRRVFSGETLQQSFQQLGLAPQAMLLVQSEDD